MAQESRRARPRIIHLLGDLRISGTANMALSRVRFLKEFEHYVWAAGRPTREGTPEITEHLHATGAHLRIAGNGRLASWSWFFAGLARARSLRPVIVHSCVYQTHIVAPHLAKVAGAALILSKEGTDDWMTLAQARREASIANEAAAVIAVSQAAARSLHRGRRVLTPISIVPCGIPPTPPDWSPLPEDEGASTILFVGRLVPAKGLADLVDAVWHLLESGRNIRLQIQGDGPAEAPLRAACARQPLAGRARVITAADRAQVPRVEPRGGGPVIFVLPSRDEGFGIVLLEAMRLGLPIIATNVGGIPEVVEDGRQGILVPPRDPAALGRAIERCLDDDGLRGRLAAAGPARAAMFTERTMCERWRRVYSEACRSRGLS